MEQLWKFLCGCFDLQNVGLLHQDDVQTDYHEALITTPVEQASYHVFLSHHGPDTRHTVVDVLREFFQRKGITCFVDSRTTEVGESIEPNLLQAIRISLMYIVVLSPRFTDSSWCLEEAAHIMDQLQRSATNKDTAPTCVLPIFYGVQPAELLSKLSLHKRYSAAQRSRWSNALYNLSQIKGFDWSNTTANFQGQATERILLRVEEFLSGSVQPYINTGPFKWESMYSSQMQQAEKALSSHASDNDVVIIGILGRHRSEFAKVLFHRFCKDFSASCILPNVKEQAKSREGLLKLQWRLLSELAKSPSNPPHFDNTGQGRAVLLDRLRYIKCLIVIDDIDDTKEQLESLLVLDKHVLCRGSRLILTTRFPSIFHDRAQIDETISLWAGNEDLIEESTKHLAICCESKDVDQGFIDLLSETFSTLGLCVSVVSGGALLDVALKKQVSLILVILSQSFNVDSPDVLNRLDEASTCSEVKLVHISYGLQSGNMSPMPRSEMDAATCNMRAFTPIFAVNFESPSKLNMTELKRFIITVMDQMQHEHKLSLTNFPVGLMRHQHKIETGISSSISERKRLKRIGIWGMGGVGKTTLAKSLYNKIHRKFEGSVFLSDVRAQSKDAGLTHLQRAIFGTVLGEFPSFTSVSEGNVLLSIRLRGTHTLIILDDVDHPSQMEALLSQLDLPPGSVVIITSRDRRILKAADVDEVFTLGPLDAEDARKLFYWHAFRNPFAPMGMRDIAHKVIDACGGLPLSLQVIGAHVFKNHDHQFWEDTLDHLRNPGKDVFGVLKEETPGDKFKWAHPEIFNVLNVSVEALDKSQKEAFLDVCCFLIGKPYETAQRVWKSCGWNPGILMDVLSSMCFISVDPTDGTIGMHDQIRYMGRYIANQGHPSKTCIWDAMDATDIPQDMLTLYRLRGFAWISQEEEVANCDALAIQRLSRVKFLLLRNVQIVGEFPNLPYNEIRWLQWQNSPFKVLPPGLCSRKLRVLDLSGSAKLEALWRDLDSSNKKVPEGLQELDLSGCKNLMELPQFDRFLRELEWFSLNGCERIDHLHNSIGSLAALKFLDLSGCKSLRCLPEAFQDLKYLEKLRLSHCSQLESLPQGIGRCHNLIEVCLDHTGLSTVPESLGDLKKLEKLTLNNCPNLTSLPRSISRCLEALRVCNLCDCPKLQELPEGFVISQTWKA